jgi:signal peptidase I
VIASVLLRRRVLVAGLSVLAAALLLAVRGVVAEPFAIRSASMSPTLSAGDSVLVDKLARAPSRGALVAFRRPGSGEILLKRVVALAGDRVGLEDGVLVVNGRRVREGYADPDAIDSVYFGPVTVPAARVFVLGDNRANSQDSRDFGAVPTKNIMGRAIARVWPPGRWGTPG